MSVKLIADSGSTKTEWCLISGGKPKKNVITQGISPYFLNEQQITALIQKELIPQMKAVPDEIFYYGTGCGTPAHVTLVTRAIKKVYPSATISVKHDLFGAARALCGDGKGVVAILGTGSNSGYFNGQRMVRNNPGLGFILGDEGSGAYLGKKVIQHYLYNTFEPDIMLRFEQKYKTGAAEILEAVYKKPLPNRYLAGFTGFLAENRGHFMIENIIEDGLNDFFFNHIYKYPESWKMPIHFTGSVAWGFRDVLQDLCNAYELQLGEVMKNPMEGLIRYHRR
jgi:N-acetylglucosamine kinase-like BadF-type ATPase